MLDTKGLEELQRWEKPSFNFAMWQNLLTITTKIRNILLRIRFLFTILCNCAQLGSVVTCGLETSNSLYMYTQQKEMEEK